MKEIGKLTVVALLSAAAGGLVVEAVNAEVTSPVQVTGPAAISEQARPKAYADWEAARSRSFASRMRTTGSSAPAHSAVLKDLDKMQELWGGGPPEK